MVLNFRAVIKVLGILTLIEGFFMLPALLVAMIFEEWQAASAFLNELKLLLSKCDEKALKVLIATATALIDADKNQS